MSLIVLIRWTPATDPDLQWLFIIFGLVTLFWAIVLLFFLPDQSQTTRWLTEEERSWAYQRVELKQKTQQTKVWEKGQVVEAVLDPKTWFFVVFNVVVCLPNGGIGNVSLLRTVPSASFFCHLAS